MVDRPRDQFLAGAAVPQQQHVDIAGRHPADQFIDLLHHRTLPDHAVAAGTGRLLRRKNHFSTHQPAALQRIIDDRLNLRYLERLQHIVERPAQGGFDRRFGGAEGSDHQHHRPGIGATDLLQHLQAGGIGQAQVEDNQVERLALQQGQPFRRAEGGRHPVIRRLQQALERVAHALFVVNHQNLVHPHFLHSGVRRS